MPKTYLNSTLKQFTYYKQLGERAMAQISDEQLLLQASTQENSIATIVKHLVGNMLSRWTDFLTSDGEKEWRHRDAEFENTYKNRQELMDNWEMGWQSLFDALNPLTEDDQDQIIYIRNQEHTVTEAINRQMMHYAYHIGQIVVLCKQFKKDDWQSLSIPLGQSKSFNKEKFAQAKSRKHFTDEG